MYPRKHSNPTTEDTDMLILLLTASALKISIFNHQLKKTSNKLFGHHRNADFCLRNILSAGATKDAGRRGRRSRLYGNEIIDKQKRE